MAQRNPGLRTILTVTTLCFLAVAMAISICLVLLTSRLHEASQSLADTVESVRLANEAEIDLLLHGRSKDALVSRDIERDLRQTLTNLRPLLSTTAEIDALREVSGRVEAYIAAAHATSGRPPAEGSEIDDAYAALETLVDINLAHTRTARERVAQWDSLASGVGFATTAALLAISGWLLWWLRSRAFRPVYGLLRSMERFGGGDRDVRAEETGPAELHQIAKRFNEMAAALAAQREVQMNFLGGVAHDLRNPLAAVKMSVESVQREPRLPPEARVRRVLDLTARQIVRMERMLGDFLDTARIEAGKLELQLDWRDGRELVRDVSSLFEASSPQHRIVVTLPPEQVWIQCDPLRMEQVLGNLLSNAVKFSPAGGDVTVALARERNEVVLSVRDTGVGMSEEDQHRLFEPFRRLGPTKDAIPGVGLGLFVVRQIVRAHGGRIEVTSAPGQGTTFRVRLQSSSPPSAMAGESRPLADRVPPPTN